MEKKTSYRKLPVGIQDFEKLRKGDFIYVDKTEYIYDLVQAGAPCFLSRPRRFGKSLFLSTIRAYFEGKRELFEGLRIAGYEEQVQEPWQKYPVFYFDFNKANFSRSTALEEVLESHLKVWEKEYNVDGTNCSLEERFQNIIVSAVNKLGRDAVVLVDEYDKPLLETTEDPAQEAHNRAVFKGFFSTLKSYDHYLKFVFLTGVTKFSKISIFSDLNHLQDISMDRDYADICGVTEKELEQYFQPEIERMAKDQEISRTDCMSKLRNMYDGYHFHYAAEGVYNPYSLLTSLRRREFGSYWFESATPTFLIRRLQETNFDAKEFTKDDLYVDERALLDYRTENPSPIPLFYQTGYLTIKGYDKQFQSMKLGYPNDEVKYGFLESLAPTYLYEEDGMRPFDVRNFCKDIEQGNVDNLRDRFAALFARLPYRTDKNPVEQDFQNIIYIVFMLLGQYVHTEVHCATGRADCIVETKGFVYIFEFKRDKSAEEALKQILNNRYDLPYPGIARKRFFIGVNFDSESRTLDGWKVETG